MVCTKDREGVGRYIDKIFRNDHESRDFFLFHFEFVSPLNTRILNFMVYENC